jgi:hypothetical protein
VECGYLWESMKRFSFFICLGSLWMCVLFRGRFLRLWRHAWGSVGTRGLKSPGARQSNGARKFGPVPGFISASLLGSGRRKLCLGT